jgi:phage-related protein
MGDMPRKVHYYADAPSPWDYINSLPDTEAANILHRLDVMSKTPVHEWPWVDHLEGKLWELKSPPHRLLYFLKEDEIIVLHAARKKGRKLNRKDIELALRRLGEFS